MHLTVTQPVGSNSEPAAAGQSPSRWDAREEVWQPSARPVSASKTTLILVPRPNRATSRQMSMSKVERMMILRMWSSAMARSSLSALDQQHNLYNLPAPSRWMPGVGREQSREQAKQPHSDAASQLA